MLILLKLNCSPRGNSIKLNMWYQFGFINLAVLLYQSIFYYFSHNGELIWWELWKMCCGYFLTILWHLLIVHLLKIDYFSSDLFQNREKFNIKWNQYVDDICIIFISFHFGFIHFTTLKVCFARIHLYLQWCQVDEINYKIQIMTNFVIILRKK